MLRIIDFCDPTNTINIIINIIINNKENNKNYTQYYSRCLEIITYKIKDIINLLNVPEIFYEINKYLIFFNINCYCKIEKRENI